MLTHNKEQFVVDDSISYLNKIHIFDIKYMFYDIKYELNLLVQIMSDYFGRIFQSYTIKLKFSLAHINFRNVKKKYMLIIHTRYTKGKAYNKHVKMQ